MWNVNVYCDRVTIEGALDINLTNVECKCTDEIA